MSENPSILSHVSIGTNAFDRAVAFYDAVLKTVGVRRLQSFPGAAAYGKMYPEFWVQVPLDGGEATPGNGTHVAFIAASKSEVEAFYRVALEAGAKEDGDPGARPQYSNAYYGCFVRDIDGHKIEATFWDSTMAG